MAGGYNPNDPPVRAGFFSRIVAAADDMASGGAGGVVAIPLVTDWGPMGLTEVEDQREFERLFGDTDDAAHFTVVGALTGNGEADSGATSVLVYRVDPTSVADATAEKDFNNTSVAAALNVAAKYSGTRGNDITITFRDHPSEAGTDQMLVLLNGDLVETFNYDEADLASLVTLVNTTEESDYVTLTLIADGTAMAAVSGIALDDTAGADGTAQASDWTAALDALEAESLNIITLPDMVDVTILASLRTWIADMNGTARRIMAVTGGTDDETFSAATTRSALSDDDENIVNLGYNMFEDPDGTARSSSEMTGYVAGMIAAAGARRSITFQRLPEGFTLTTAPTVAEVVSGIEGGLVLFTKDAAGVRVEKGVTTFTDDTDADKPLSVMSSIQKVRTLHQIENDLTDTTETEWIGQVQNTPKTRENYVGMILSYLRTLEGQNILQPGSQVRLDETQDNTGDTLYPIYTVEMGVAVERVLAIGEVS